MNEPRIDNLPTFDAPRSLPVTAVNAPGTNPLPSTADSPAAPQTPATRPIARYQLVEALARGGMGLVYLARDLWFNREVAVKVIRPEHRGLPGAVARFRREAELSAQLQHPNIPAVHDTGELPDGSPFLVMRVIRGKTLAELLEEHPGRTDGPELLRVFEEVAQAVAYAHSRGVIHRDLKPGNVMVGEFGEVQVMDWGLAKRLGETDAVIDSAARAGGQPDDALTRAGRAMGTLAYMPPEQAVGDLAAIDRRSDVFALGAILFEILTGEPLASGGPDVFAASVGLGDLMNCRLRLSRARAEPPLAEIVLACLATDPLRRPPDAGALAHSLASWRRFAEDWARQSELATTASVAKVLGRRESAGRFGAIIFAVGAISLVLCYAIVVVFFHVFDRR